MTAGRMHGNLNGLTAGGIQKSAVHSTTQRKTLQWDMRELAVLMNGINSRECAAESIAVRAGFYSKGCADWDNLPPVTFFAATLQQRLQCVDKTPRILLPARITNRQE